MAVPEFTDHTAEPDLSDTLCVWILFLPTRATVVALALTLFASIPATAQQAAPIEASAGYLALSAGSTGYPKGYYADFVVNLNSRLGIVVATDAAYRGESFEHLTFGRGPSGTIIQRVPLTLNKRTHGLVAGGRVAWRDPRVDLFVQGSVGAARSSVRTLVDSSFESAQAIRDAYDFSAWRWAVQGGGGANIAISSHIAARVGVDYRRLKLLPRVFTDAESRGRSPNQMTITGGIVWTPRK